jgi:hypothetical protein
VIIPPYCGRGQYTSFQPRLHLPGLRQELHFEGQKELLVSPEKQIPTTAFVVEKPGAPFVLQNVILDEVRANEAPGFSTTNAVVGICFSGIMMII